MASIRRIIRAVDLHSRQLVGGHGLTGPQLAVLQAISRIEQATPSAIAKDVHLSQATVTGILRRLQERSLVVRERSPKDGRSVLIAMTKDGEKLLEASPSLLQDRFRNALSELSKDEQLRMLSTLQQVASLMDAEEIDASPMLVPGDVSQSAENGH
ncbi:MarR family winged helix-turn-helix transcriptional regulator [Rhodopirellula halodulae]|uniref:MarR family winged helix-turn-helix transcriptional regulator n=1 Tax=Rhodopirellula halodulae TaxID=2894198 RepID=UPI001E5BED96|nr:MarR family transcriptional regulator [Rhodopirellula sp. JC737]MCC9655887.1 MarR family transcriptional regulator [Rhodopirellula sp. JC737]